MGNQGENVVRPSEPGPCCAILANIDKSGVCGVCDYKHDLRREKRDDLFVVGSDEYIDEVFQYHAPTREQVALYNELRHEAQVFAKVIARLCPSSPDRTAAFRKLRECVHVANGSIALKGRA